jgi:hypothetical protein
MRVTSTEVSVCAQIPNSGWDGVLDFGSPDWVVTVFEPARDIAEMRIACLLMIYNDINQLGIFGQLALQMVTIGNARCYQW